MNLLLRTVFCLLAAAHWGAANAQKSLLRHFTIKEGLPSNVVYNIHQDKRGFIWFFTDQGVSQFDGHRFQNYSINEGLPDNEVFNMGEDNYGRLWLVCYNRQPCYILNGQVYNSQNDKLCREIERLQIYYTLLFVDRKGICYLEGHRICALYKDSVSVAYTEIQGADIGGAQYSFINGYEYFVRANKILIKSGGAKKVIQLAIAGSVYLSVFNGDQVFIISTDEKKNILYHYHLNADKVSLITMQELPGFCYAVHYESDSTIMCSTAKGIYGYNIPKHILYRSETYPDSKPFNKLLKDDDGNTWLGTLNDGAYMRVGDQAFIYNAASGLIADNVLSINRQSDGKVIANFSNGGFSIIDGNKVVNVALPVTDNLNRLLFTYQLSPQEFIAGSDRGLYRILTPGSIRQMIYSGAQKACHQKGDIYYVAASGGAVSYDGRSRKLTQLWEQRTTAIAADDAGNIWMGTLNGLYLHNRGAVLKFERDSTLSNSRITGLTCMAGERLIIATHKSGLYIWDGTRLTNINKTNGLSSNSCNRLTADSAGRLWVCTDKGLDRISFGTASAPTIYHYSASDGLPTNKVTDVAVSGAHIYIATAEGIVLLKKDGPKAMLHPPKIYILSVATHDTVLTYPETALSLPYNENDLQISYTGIAVSSGGDLQYRYILKGGSSDTVYTKGGALNLSAIKPGTYRLLLWAKIEGGDSWSAAPASFSFIIRPPFWRTTWFLLLAGGLTILLISAVYVRKVRSVRRIESEKSYQKQRMADLEQMALRAQMNPHFIFNSLNSFYQYIIHKDLKGASKFMGDFSTLLRLMFEITAQQEITLDKELLFLRTYLEIERTKLRDRFDYIVEVAENLPPAEEILIPTFIIQPFVENSIRHGIAGLEMRSGHITISFSKDVDELVVRVADNGVGRRQSMAQKEARLSIQESRGMSLTGERISLYNKTKATNVRFEVEDGTPNGTLVIIHFPLDPNL